MLQLSAIPQEEHFWTSVEHGWRLDLSQFVRQDLPHILFVLLIAFILQRLTMLIVRRMNTVAIRLKEDNPQRASQLRTTASILRATSYSLIGAIVLLHILARLGYNLTPLLASAGLVSVGIALGAQSLFKDIINGLFILFEDQYNVGETVKLAGLTGTVEDLSLRLTKVRDADGTLHFIPNSQVATVSNLSRDFAVAVLPVNVEATADPGTVIATLRAVAISLSEDEALRPLLLGAPDVPGIDRLQGNDATYLINLRVRISQRDRVLRALRRRVLEAFQAEDIPLSSNTSTVIVKNDPTAPPSQQPIGS